MAHEVLFYHSGMMNPPITGVLSGTAGKLITLLDALLVNGLNSVGVASLSQTGGTAVLQTSAANNFSPDEIIEISGSTDPNYNGRFRVLTKPAVDTVTFAVNAAWTTSPGGAMNVKHPALGWTKAFAGTNKAIYRTKVGSSLGHYLQVDDASTTNPQLKMIHNATGFDTGDTVTSAVSWTKRSDSRWVLVGDHKTFYLFNAVENVSFAGETTKFRSDDAFNFMVSHAPDTAGSTIANPIVVSTSTMNLLYALKSVNQVTPWEKSAVSTVPLHIVTAWGGVGDFYYTTRIVAGPNAIDGKFHFMQLPIFEQIGVGTRVLRGRFRGVYQSNHYLTSGFSASGYQILPLSVNGQTRKLMFCQGAYNEVILDITDTWA